MPSEIVMPRMGLTMETGRIVSWLKQVGQTVKAGELLLEIETDKATAEIESLESGVLGKIIGNPGEEFAVGAVIGYLTKEGETLDQKIIAPASNATIDNAKVKASPAARRLAQKLGVGLSQVSGSGPNGRIVAWNVTEAAKSADKRSQPDVGRISPVAQRVAANLGVDLTQVKGSGPGGAVTRKDVEFAAQMPGCVSAVETGTDNRIKVEPFTRIQRVMAERMTQSFSTAPHFYLHVDVDARQLVALREQLLPRLEKRDGIRVTFTDLLVYLCGRTLPKHPLVMTQWTAEGLKKFNRARDADKLGLVEIARQRIDLAERARQGKLLPNEFEEGVFTITNLGMYHIDSFDAILNPPQAAILAVGQIKERGLVENGQLIPAAMMNLSLSVDHRVLDGARAARFLNELVETIEIPSLSMT
jgi:pyruvate dehydrogenase E2 component (dihydrolipoamide acetyltransferase)